MKHGKYQYFTAEEERELHRKMTEEGDQEARETLIYSYIPYTLAEARRINKVITSLEYDEVESTCLWTLVKCVDGLDPNKGRLGTYLGNSLYRAVRRQVNRCRLIQLPYDYGTKRTPYTAETRRTENPMRLFVEGEGYAPVDLADYRHSSSLEQEEQDTLHQARWEAGLATLSPGQLAVFQQCVIGKEDYISVAADREVSRQRIHQLAQKGTANFIAGYSSLPRKELLKALANLKPIE